MINLSKMLSSIKMDLGVYGLALPFDNPDEMFKEVIHLKTLPIFSQFQPYYTPIKLNLDELEKVEETCEYVTYELPDIFGDRDILSIRKMQEDTEGFGLGMMDPGLYTGASWGDIMMGQAEANLASVAVQTPTFKYIQPNRIQIFNYSVMYSHKIRLEIAMEHSDNLATIPKTCYHSFYSLASLDIKLMLYNNLKHYNDLQTAFGNINLKIDDWANAESERADLIRRWEETYHLDVAQFMII